MTDYADLRKRVEDELDIRSIAPGPTYELIRDLWAWGQEQKIFENDLTQSLKELSAEHDRVCAQMQSFKPVTAEELAEPVPLTTNQAQTILNALGTLYRASKPLPQPETIIGEMLRLSQTAGGQK